jgi:uncharacterized membrane protein YdfJ with MMPL/SSD domain
MKRAGVLAEALKCWCVVLSGIAKIAPAFHSKVTLVPASFHTVGRAAAVEDVDHLLEELALRRELLPGGISHT